MSPEQDKLIIDMYCVQKMGTKEISRYFNCHSGTIIYRLKKHNVAIKAGKPNLSEEQRIQIATEYHLPTKTQIILNKYNISLGILRNILRKYAPNTPRAVLRSPRKHHYNRSFFHEIDTEDKAYFLGFLMADGYVSNDSRSRTVGLRVTDEEIIKKFAKSLGNENLQFSIREANTDKHGVTRKKSFCLSLNSKEMVEDLAKHQLIARKTNRTEIPPTIPPYLVRHFIRGYFDGDGWCYVKESNKIIGVMGIVSASQKILKQIEKELKDKFILRPEFNFIRISKNKQYSLINISGKEERIKFGEYLYQNATIYLERKRNKFLSFKKAIDDRPEIIPFRVIIHYDKRTKHNPYGVKLQVRGGGKTQHLAGFSSREEAIRFRNEYILKNGWENQMKLR